MNLLLNLDICLAQCEQSINPITRTTGLKNYFVTASEDTRDIGTYRLIKLAHHDSGDITQLNISDKFTTSQELFLEFWTSDDTSSKNDITPIGALKLYLKNSQIVFDVPHPNEYLGYCNKKNMRRFLLNDSPIPYNICLNIVSAE